MQCDNNIGDIYSLESERMNDKLVVVTEIVGIKIKNQQDELKVKIIARLYKNLTLEQLENVETVVKKTIFDKKNYVLELP